MKITTRLNVKVNTNDGKAFIPVPLANANPAEIAALSSWKYKTNDFRAGVFNKAAVPKLLYTHYRMELAAHLST